MPRENPPVLRIPTSAARKLGWYVYLYVNPLNEEVFYVGKGRGQRALDHLTDDSDSRKISIIRRIRRVGEEPRIEILAHGIRDEATAFRVEAAAIDLLGLPSLSNQVRGWRSLQYGRIGLVDLVSHYRRKKVTIHEPGILIRISRLFRSKMDPTELYDATRGIWRVGVKRERAKYAFPVFEGVIREVYEIAHWFPAGSTLSTRDYSQWEGDRWEFVGRLAPQAFRRRYIDRYVGHLFKVGSQNPIVYVNIE